MGVDKIDPIGGGKVAVEFNRMIDASFSTTRLAALEDKPKDRSMNITFRGTSFD